MMRILKSEGNPGVDSGGVHVHLHVHVGAVVVVVLGAHLVAAHVAVYVHLPAVYSLRGAHLVTSLSMHVNRRGDIIINYDCLAVERPRGFPRGPGYTPLLHRGGCTAYAAQAKVVVTAAIAGADMAALGVEDHEIFGFAEPAGADEVGSVAPPAADAEVVVPPTVADQTLTHRQQQQNLLRCTLQLKPVFIAQYHYWMGKGIADEKHEDDHGREPGAARLGPLRVAGSDRRALLEFLLVGCNLLELVAAPGNHHPHHPEDCFCRIPPIFIAVLDIFNEGIGCGVGVEMAEELVVGHGVEQDEVDQNVDLHQRVLTCISGSQPLRWQMMEASSTCITRKVEGRVKSDQKMSLSNKIKHSPTTSTSFSLFKPPQQECIGYYNPQPQPLSYPTRIA